LVVRPASLKVLYIHSVVRATLFNANL